VVSEERLTILGYVLLNSLTQYTLIFFLVFLSTICIDATCSNLNNSKRDEIRELCVMVRMSWKCNCE